MENKKNEHKYIRVNGYVVSEHRYIWEMHHGKIPKGMMIHHINHNKADNRIWNLMIVSSKEHGKLHQKKNRKRIYYKKCGAYAVVRLKE